jgi:hypothetical protein
MFEASPRPGHIMHAKGSSYPGSAIKVPLNAVNDTYFVTEFALFLEAMDFRPQLYALPHSSSSIPELRSTIYPIQVTSKKGFPSSQP